MFLSYAIIYIFAIQDFSIIELKNMRTGIVFDLVFFLTLLIGLSSVDAKDLSFNNFIVSGRNSKLKTSAEMKLKAAEMQHLLMKSRDVVLNDFPVSPEIKGTALLTRKRNVIDANTNISIAGFNGDRKSDIPLISVFTGSLKENPEAKVFLFLSGNFFISSVSFPDGSAYVIAPEKKNDGSFILNRSSDFASSLENFKCLADEKKLIQNIENQGKTSGILSNDLLQAEIAIETDSEFYKNTGSDTNKAKLYILALISLVSHYYELETDICFYVNWLKIWTDSPADPYGVKGDAYALPDKVREYWKNNYSEVKRDFFHVVTSIGYGGGGFGYYDALCGKNGDYGFSVSSVQGYHNLPTYAFTYDVYILAHEMGHNFNSPHSHNCYWGAPLDTCVTGEAIEGKCLDSSVTARPNPGSIMSYCGGINNEKGLGWQVRMTFLPPVINLIRQTAEKAKCITEPPAQMISLMSPHGQEQYNAGDIVKISWKSAWVDVLALEYSADGGKSWFEIVQNYPAANEFYEWKMPNICSSRMLVRAYDFVSPEYADTTKLTFKVSMEDSTGLVAYYPFNKNSNDEQICHRFDAANNGALLTNDRASFDVSAYYFDGSSYLSVPSFDARFDELTISLWFFAEDAGAKRNFIGTNWEEGWSFETYYWGQVGAAYYLDGAGAPTQLWAGSPELNKWHHFAFTFDGTYARIFVDGIKTGEQSDGKTHKLNPFENTPLYIGSRKNDDFFKGKLDDIKIFKRALNANEIVLLSKENVPYDVEDNTDLTKKISAISPNPSSGIFDFTLSARFVSHTSITFYNQLGEKMLEYRNVTPESKLQIDMSMFPAGVYYYIIKCSELTESAAFILIK